MIPRFGQCSLRDLRHRSRVRISGRNASVDADFVGRAGNVGVERRRRERLRRLGGPDIREPRRVASGADVRNPTQRIVVVAARVRLRRRSGVRDAPAQRRLVVGDAEIAVVAPCGPPAVFHDPRAGARGRRREVRRRVRVVPADDDDAVIRFVYGRSGVEGVRRGVPRGRKFVHSRPKHDGNRAPVEDRLFDDVAEQRGVRRCVQEGRDVDLRHVQRVGQVRGRRLAARGIVRAAVGAVRLVRGAATAREHGDGLEVGSARVVDRRDVGREGDVVGVGEISQVSFGEVRGRAARLQDRGFERPEGREGPAGPVRGLVAHGRHMAARPQVVPERQRRPPGAPLFESRPGDVGRSEVDGALAISGHTPAGGRGPSSRSSVQEARRHGRRRPFSVGPGFGRQGARYSRRKNAQNSGPHDMSHGHPSRKIRNDLPYCIGNVRRMPNRCGIRSRTRAGVPRTFRSPPVPRRRCRA